MLLATVQVLQKEKEEYEERVEFLASYVQLLRTNTYEDEFERLEALDKAYRLEKELGFKKQLIAQRSEQIDQVIERQELKIKAVQETPELIEKAKKVYDSMIDDLEDLNKQKKTKELMKFKKNLETNIDQVEVMIDHIEKRFEENPEHKGLLNDFRQLHEIIKIK